MNKPIFALTLLGVAQMTSGAYMETFDTDSANWLYGYGANYTEGTTTWNPVGGAPGGHIAGTAENLYAVWTYDTAVYGDLRGLSFSVDTKIEGISEGNAQFYVGREGTYYISAAWDISNNTNWSTYSAPLDSSNMTHWASGGTQTLDFVLIAPDDIGIFFGGSLVAGTGELLLDNFGTCTEPIQIQPDSVATDQNTARHIDVLANDNGLLFTYGISGISQPSHGSVSVAADGSLLTYYPAQGFTGEDHFTYTATNGLDSATTNVDVMVIAPSVSQTSSSLRGTTPSLTFSVRTARKPSVQSRQDMRTGSWKTLSESSEERPRIRQFVQSASDPNNYTIELEMHPDHTQDFFRIIVPTTP
jgi:hypothetical protein